MLLHVRRRDTLHHLPIYDDHRIIPYLMDSGFYGIHRVGFMQIDWALVTALVERWRPETHTFHLPVGECTITLQDVAVLLGLPIQGKVVTGTSKIENGRQLCLEQFGLELPDKTLIGGRLKLTWLQSNFAEIPEEADEDVVHRYVRAYIFQLIGGSIFTDHSQQYVFLMFLPLLQDITQVGEYSWGGAALAWLYRELCKASRIGVEDMCSPVILLQLWAWEHISFTAPEKLNLVNRPQNIPPGPLGER